MAAAPPEVVIRPMRREELPETLDVWVAAWQAAYPAIDFEARRGWAEQHFGELARTGSEIILALAAARIVGVMTVNPGTGYLDQIVVATDHQGHGTAELLLAEARRLSPAGLDLDVNQDNARAIAFYEKHGFARTGAGVNGRSGAPIFKMSWWS